MRVTSGSWVILRDQVLEMRDFERRLYVGRTEPKPNDWDRPVGL
jgi:hypothetical protein